MKVMGHHPSGGYVLLKVFPSAAGQLRRRQWEAITWALVPACKADRKLSHEGFLPCVILQCMVRARADQWHLSVSHCGILFVYPFCNLTTRYRYICCFNDTCSGGRPKPLLHAI